MVTTRTQHSQHQYKEISISRYGNFHIIRPVVSECQKCITYIIMERVDVDIDALSLWLCTESEVARGDGGISELVIQLLQSPMGCDILLDYDVQEALQRMMLANDVHHGLNAINKFLEKNGDQRSAAYLEMLSREHDCLHNPPFPSTDSMLWVYRSIPVALPLRDGCVIQSRDQSD
jgi:hypothetical protein